MEHNETENVTMFNMQEIGARIALLRREADLTQAELAEHLGISYQAVSSWERGASMPDISKLLDLARVLHTTVDVLLSGDETAAEKPGEIAPELQEHVQWAVEHAAEKPAEKKIDMHTILRLAPFLPVHELEKLALEACDEANYDMLRRLAPFLSTRTLEQLLDRCDGVIDKRSICVLAPFVSRQYLEAMLDRCDVMMDAELLLRMAPFLSQQTLVKLINRLRGE